MGRVPESIVPVNAGKARGIPDPLDDYNLISDEQVERRLYEPTVKGSIRWFLLRLLRWATPVLLIYFVYITEAASSPGRIGEVVLVVLLVAGSYLVIVRMDAGTWGLVHPLIPVAYQRFRRERDVVRLVIGMDLFLAVAIILFCLSGWVFRERGITMLLLLIGVGIVANLGIILVAFTAEETGEEFF
jgi:membrane-associated HD superfamily phosphohydrolase